MGGEPPVSTESGSRYFAVILFVAAWMAAGWLLRLDPNLYLVLGVPLTVLFQRLVRRQPTQALWVREAPPLGLGWKGIVIALCIRRSCRSRAWSALRSNTSGAVFCTGVAPSRGQSGRQNAPAGNSAGAPAPLLWCLLITLGLDVIQWSLFFGVGLIEIRSVGGGVGERVAVGVVSLLQYMAVVFAMEEVAFRMLDSHLHEAERGRGVRSAIFISAVWGLWHLPIVPELTWGARGFCCTSTCPTAWPCRCSGGAAAIS